MAATTLAGAWVGEDEIEGFPAVALTAGELTASFVPSLGMVGASLRHAGEELLDRRDGLAAYRDTGAVCGIPLLHPWANRLDGFTYALHGRDVVLPDGPPLVRCEEHGLPIHGLLGAHPGWGAVRTQADGHAARLRARLDLRSFPDVLAAFPFAHAVIVDVLLTPDRLTIATTLRPTGGPPVPIAFGYHPYLTLPGVPREQWRVTLPRRRHLALDARSIPTGRARHEAPAAFTLGDRAFDDGYDRIEPGAVFAVEGGGRRIAVTHEAGYPVAQIYSPAGAPFICFEPMTAPTNALRSGTGLRRVIPGDHFTAVFSIAVDMT
jgi:galactose mutarotase-like enzyme